MVDLIILRYSKLENATLGVAIVNGKRVADTLELPWKENKDEISCIPCGIYNYEVGKQNKPPHSKCIKIHDVPSRDAIQIHAANYVSQLRGCIAVGILMGSSIMVGNSVITLEKLLQTIPSKGFIQIKEA